LYRSNDYIFEIKGYMMNRLCFFIFAGSLTFLFSCATVQTQKESSYDPNDIVRWTDSTKLSWDDFTGTPPTDTTLGAYMIILTPAEFQESTLLDSATATVECYMVKNASWVVESKAKKQLLAYYQIMFDINELSARKLRKIISETNFNVEDPVSLLNNINNKHKKKLSKTLSQYNAETKLGADTKKLMEWQEKMTHELSALEEYRCK
jgi:hypothetical protein